MLPPVGDTLAKCTAPPYVPTDGPDVNWYAIDARLGVALAAVIRTSSGTLYQPLDNVAGVPSDARKMAALVEQPTHAAVGEAASSGACVLPLLPVASNRKLTGDPAGVYVNA